MKVEWSNWAMANFKTLSENVLASEQISIADIAAAKAAGVAVIVNNRPDGEDLSAPQSKDVEAEAGAIGLRYVPIPIGNSGFSAAQVDAMIEVLQSSEGKVLAYCRSGTRSTLLWALSSAKMGVDPGAIAQAAIAAGYDVSPVRPMMDMLTAR